MRDNGHKETVTVEVKSEGEMRVWEKDFKDKGFKKISDCMWVKIYDCAEYEFILNRNY